ncbi:MAG: methyl-accepting chemotaxis protein [Burkholderiales bacterium]|nr:methyl-accepting chemotaxis protein [Burkholderiales bacterium]
MFKNMKIGMRLGLGFGLILFLLSVTALIGIGQLGELNRNVGSVLNDRYPKTSAANEIAFRAMDNTRIILNIILNPDDKIKAKNKDAYDSNIARNIELFDQLDKAVKSEEGRGLLKAMHEARAAYNSYTAEVIRLGLAGKPDDAARVLYGENYKTQAAYFASIKKLVEYQERQMTETGRQAEENYASTRVMMLGLAVAAFLLGSGIAFQVTRGITRPIGEAVRVANRLAGGDLTGTIEVNSTDETGMLLAAMRNMAARLKEMISEILGSADQVSSTAAQLSAASGQVADGSRQQSEAASAMASAVEEMTVSIDQVSGNAQNARNASRHSGEMSEQGAAVIQNAVTEMAKIEGSVKESSQIIEALEQQSGEISAIVNVIKEIADQTNLLALNAAIEAARAGEQGRGFAVVADEVRKLAERTTTSTQEIAAMIEKIQIGTREAVNSMESGVSRVSSGVALASQAGQSITQIKDEATLVAQAVSDISDSLKEQSAASNDIARNVERIAQMTEENSMAVQQTASAAQLLEQLASSLQATVGRFRV